VDEVAPRGSLHPTMDVKENGVPALSLVTSYDTFAEITKAHPTL